MDGERQSDEERFEREGLVIGAGEEEVIVAGGYGTGDERDERRVRYVEGGEDCEGVGGVSLSAENLRRWC